jgi:hypothetical protein
MKLSYLMVSIPQLRFESAIELKAQNTINNEDPPLPAATGGGGGRCAPNIQSNTNN